MSSNPPPPSRDSSSVPPAAPVRSTDGSAAPHDTWFGGRCDERLLADIVETSRDGIAAFDLQCRYTVWNAEMERISGVPRSRTIGVVAWDAFPFLKDIGEDRHFHRALAGEQSVATERPFHVPQTGRQGFFDAIYAPL